MEDIVHYALQKSHHEKLWEDFYLISVKGIDDPSHVRCELDDCVLPVLTAGKHIITFMI